MYCWRCGIEVPILGEDEFAIVEQLYARAVRSMKESCLNYEESSQADFIREQYFPVLEAYRRLTGQDHTTHAGDLMYHRISKYGPPCSQCGKPLWTPRAKHCAACGTDGPVSTTHDRGWLRLRVPAVAGEEDVPADAPGPQPPQSCSTSAGAAGRTRTPVLRSR